MVAPKGPLLPILGADPNHPRELSLVGRYALGVTWQDSHGSIYPFEFLRAVCPCPACRATEPGEAATGPTVAGACWPTEIAREADAVRIRWQDGHETHLAHGKLRRLCRCATCTGAH